MLYIVSFLLSWLSGMLAILITAFFKYDDFSLIDIASFATISFAGLLLLFLSIYLIVLRAINNKIIGNKQFIYFPIIFSLLANLPVYFLIWKKMGDLYGSSEAALFTFGFLISGFVSGLFHAWKNKVLSNTKRI